MRLGIPIFLVIVVFLTIAMLFTAGWDRPPIESEQLGYDGVGMVDHNNPRRVAADKAQTEIPPETPTKTCRFSGISASTGSTG